MGETMSDNTQITPQQLQALMQYASKRLGTTPEALARTVQQGGVEGLASQLPASDMSKLQAVIGDKARMEQLLQSPQVQQILRQISGQ